MPNNTARKIFNIQEGEQNLKVYDPAVTRGDLIKYDEELTIGGGGTVNSVTATAPLTSSGGVNPNIAMPAATAVVDGYLTAADWLTFNGKQGALTLTTVGSSGAATLVGNTLNIPNYAGATYTFSTGLTDTSGTVTSNLSTGVAGGQTAVGGTAASNSLTLSSTSNATKGKILFGTSAYDEVNNRLGIGTASPAYAIDITSTSPFFGLDRTSGVNPVLFFFRIGGSGGANVGIAGQTGDQITGTVANDLFLRTNGYSIFFGTSSTPWARFASTTGNLILQNGGTLTDAGFRLDVNGTARVQERLTISDDSTVTTQTVAVITTDTTNAGLVLRPNGTGAIMAQAPDGTSTGGNARGINAVDLQTNRNNAAQVASGNNSVIIGGQQNTASATNSTVVGGGGSSVGNTASGYASAVVGGDANTSAGSNAAILAGSNNNLTGSYAGALGGIFGLGYLYSQQVRASGRFAATGDAQTSSITLRRSITGTGIAELFLDGSSARAILNISSPGPTNARVWNAMIQVVAVVATAGSGTVTLNEVFSGTYTCAIKRVGTTTSMVGAVNTAGEISDTNMATAVVTIDADDTNEALRIQFTPPTTAAADTVIRVVATAYLTEVGR